jgi:hypothetical protein
MAESTKSRVLSWLAVLKSPIKCPCGRLVDRLPVCIGIMSIWRVFKTEKNYNKVHLKLPVIPSKALYRVPPKYESASVHNCWMFYIGH